MLMLDLPVDLVEEILSRVPALCLARLRSTCKRWNNLFKDERFTQKHLLNAPKQPRVLMLKEYKFVPTSVDLNFVPPSIKFEDELDLKYYNSSEHVLVEEVFHCDGLLLCTTKKYELVVWNPCSGETRWIKQKDTSCFFGEPEFALGYEDNQSCRSYKILMFWGCGETLVDGFEIYELNSNSWRVINAPHCFEVASPGVTLKGNSYWIDFDDKEQVDYLLRFDFTRERFKRLCFPLTAPDNIYTALSVVREELSVLRGIMGSSKMEMWVTNKIDTSEGYLSWSKFFAVNYDSRICNSLLIDEDKKVALCCDSHFGKDMKMVVWTVGEEDKYYTGIAVAEKHYQHSYIFNYVPSLVQIQQYIEPDDVTTSGMETSQYKTDGNNNFEMWDPAG